LPEAVTRDGLALQLVHQYDRGHQKTGSTEPALESVLLQKGLLQRMQPAVLCQSLDGSDVHSVDRTEACVAPEYGHHGTILRLLQCYFACAALADATTQLRPGEPQLRVVVQKVHEKLARRYAAPVDLHAVHSDIQIYLFTHFRSVPS